MFKDDDPIYQRCKAELFDLNSVPADQLNRFHTTRLYYVPPAIKGLLQDIMDVEQEQFGDNAFYSSQMMDFLLGRNNTNVLLRDSETEKVVGFTFSSPTVEEYPNSYPDRNFSAETAYITDTAIATAYQKHHLVGKMMTTLESVLRKRGYTHIERDASTNNDYAANIKKAYAKRIEAEQGPHASPYGPQVFFRIRL